MKEQGRIPFTVRHTTIQVYFCMSQYSSKGLIITKVKHLFK